MCERMARTGPLMFTMNAPSYGLAGATSSKVSSVRPQTELGTWTRERSREVCLVVVAFVIVMPLFNHRSPKLCVYFGATTVDVSGFEPATLFGLCDAVPILYVAM